MGNLSVNPIQDLEQRTGRAAITLLVLSLLCTPLNTLFGWKEPLKRRRALGLYAFMYATIHVLIFLDLDYGLAWSLIIQTSFEKPYIIFGAITFLLLTPLADDFFRHLENPPQEKLETAAPGHLLYRPAGRPAFCPVKERRHLPFAR